MAGPNDDRPEGAPSHIHIEKNKGFNWLPWLLLALGILALLFALSRCNREDTAAVAPVPTATPTEVVAATPNAGSADALVGTSGLGTYLAGTEPLPRTFTFEKLNFDTAKSNIRPADAAEVNEVAATLKQYPNARIRIAGYADARGTDAANMALGKARADSVKSALVAQGINASRIETVSGGETNPVDTNATAGGRFENRRTELVVTAR
ncbi:outer membrane protein OmpA-like peptidoglycan-associated protein [Sphingomonas sp. BE138]|uniref:OmpA family protein n=1 Tax=Sphingomonas sp. BE138 TaxID=2817845 RepID=UPI0028645126|nr:OmpA family protein [Sphingomonas sp. BE138]MDR6790550.1 outer membrane protein OmpA-like peptidoglycan-associated protein [Sphingomonas sp. BE138]